MMQNYAGSGQPTLPEDLDLDKFLDSYLVQLQSDVNPSGAPVPAAAGVQTGPPPQAAAAALGADPSLALGGGAGGAPGAALGLNSTLAALAQQLPGGLTANLLSPYMNLQQGGPQMAQAGPPAPLPGLGLSALQSGAPGLGGLQAANMAGLAGTGGLGGLGSMAHAAGMQLPGMGPAAVQAAVPPSAPTTSARPRRQTAKGGNSRGKREQDSAGVDSDGNISSGGSASSGEQKSRKKREVSNNEDMSVAERRHLALQEKNRRAQRRFRERQKAKIADLHKQIEELTAKVGSLHTENAALHSRTSILEKVLDMRNEQIQVMQESKEITQQAEEHQDVPPLTLSAVTGQSISLTSDMLKELSPDQIYKIYQTYIKELSARLVELNKGAPPVHVEKLTKEVSFLLMRLSVVRPIETRKFIAVSRQYLNTEAEAIDMWKNVVRSINLSDQQKQDIVQWKQLFMQKVEPIVEERKTLNVQIQAHLPQESFHTRNAITYIKTHEAVAKLRENLRAEHNVTIEFCTAVFKGVLNSFQMASLLVQAYPAVPDALAVASAVIADMTDSGQAVPAKVSQIPQFEGINGLSVCAPLLCPPGSQDANQPTTAAGAAAAAAAAGVSQGAAICIGSGGPNGGGALQMLQMASGQGQPQVGNVGLPPANPASRETVPGLPPDLLAASALNGWPVQGAS